MTFLQLEIQPFLQLKKVPISSENIKNIMYISPISSENINNIVYISPKHATLLPALLVCRFC